MQALLLNFRHQGKEAIEKVARNQPAAYLKILRFWCLARRCGRAEAGRGIGSKSKIPPGRGWINSSF